MTQHHILAVGVEPYHIIPSLQNPQCSLVDAVPHYISRKLTPYFFISLFVLMYFDNALILYRVVLIIISTQDCKEDGDRDK